MFGFRGVIKLEEQFFRAVKFLKEVEQEWEGKVRSNNTSLQFHQFFYYTATGQGVDLPIDFEEQYIKLIKGDKT